MSSKESKKDYEVGYGKPPMAPRFKPGQSGNRLGRPRRLPEMLELFGKELKRKHTIIEGGQQVSVPMRQLLVKRLLHLASKDVRALLLALEWANQHQQREHHRVTMITDGMTLEEAAEAYRQMLRDTRMTPYMPGEERE
jgi:hypothetical protein